MLGGSFYGCMILVMISFKEMFILPCSSCVFCFLPSPSCFSLNDVFFDNCSASRFNSSRSFSMEDIMFSCSFLSTGGGKHLTLAQSGVSLGIPSSNNCLKIVFQTYCFKSIFEYWLLILLLWWEQVKMMCLVQILSLIPLWLSTRRKMRNQRFEY